MLTFLPFSCLPVCKLAFWFQYFFRFLWFVNYFGPMDDLSSYKYNSWCLFRIHLFILNAIRPLTDLKALHSESVSKGQTWKTCDPANICDVQDMINMALFRCTFPTILQGSCIRWLLKMRYACVKLNWKCQFWRLVQS